MSIGGTQFDAVEVASPFEVDPTIRSETVTQGEPLAVDVAVGQTGASPATIEPFLRDVVCDDWRFDAAVFAVPADRTVEHALSWETNTPYEYPLQLNGREIGVVMVEESA